MHGKGLIFHHFSTYDVEATVTQRLNYFPSDLQIEWIKTPEVIILQVIIRLTNLNRISAKISKKTDRFEETIRSGEAPAGDATTSDG